MPNVPNFLSLLAVPSQLFVLHLIQLCCDNPHIKVILFYMVLNVSPQLTPSLLSTELQYSLLMQIKLNPPIAAVSRKSQTVSQKNGRVGRYQKNMCMRMVACVCNSCSCLSDLMLTQS